MKAGDLLFRIDPGAVRRSRSLQAEAQLAAAELQTSQLEVQAVGHRRRHQRRRGQSGDPCSARLSRQQALLGARLHDPRRDYDDAVNEVHKARDRSSPMRAPRSNNASGGDRAGRQPAGDRGGARRRSPRRGSTCPARHRPRADRAAIVAKADRLLVGQSAITGVAMLSIVDRQAGAWVEANFKEGDLAHMAVGQPAEVTLRRLSGAQARRAMSRRSAPARAANSRSFRRRTPTAIGSR